MPTFAALTPGTIARLHIVITAFRATYGRPVIAFSVRAIGGTLDSRITGIMMAIIIKAIKEKFIYLASIIKRY